MIIKEEFSQLLFKLGQINSKSYFILVPENCKIKEKGYFLSRNYVLQNKIMTENFSFLVYSLVYEQEQALLFLALKDLKRNSLGLNFFSLSDFCSGNLLIQEKNLLLQNKNLGENFPELVLTASLIKEYRLVLRKISKLYRNALLNKEESYLDFCTLLLYATRTLNLFSGSRTKYLSIKDVLLIYIIFSHFDKNFSNRFFYLITQFNLK